MYSNKFVVCIKANGKVLRETKDLVHLPFGSEFSVLVKNLNSRRAKFTLHIDGTDVLDGTEIIVNANSEVEMKRFIRNGNMDEGNAFKFIERTAAIEDGPRGIKVDDGVVRVEFTFEQETPVVTTTYHRDVWYEDVYRRHRYFGDPFYGTYNSITTSNIVGSDGLARSAPAPKLGSAIAKGASAELSANSLSASYSATSTESLQPLSNAAPVNDVGITVPGSKVEQKFTTVYGFRPEAQSHVIILRLAGTVGEVEVAAPVTVKTKQKCVTCGHVNKANAKFCSDCGTSLTLL